MKNAAVAVCDDEPAVCNQVKKLVDEFLGRESCRIFRDCNEFIGKVKSGG